MFHYHSNQTHFTKQNGEISQETQTVEVKNGKGTITVTKIHDGKKVSKKHPLTHKQIKNIEERKFMPGLFRSINQKVDTSLRRPCLDHCDKMLTLPLDMSKKAKATRKRTHTRKIHTK